MSGKKRVLLIAYYFPPCGLGGVQRAAKLARYLPGYNWDVTVLTVKDIAYYNKDRTLLEETEHVHIIRTGSLDPLRLSHLFLVGRKAVETTGKPGILSQMFRYIERRLFVPDSKLLWNVCAYRRAAEVIRDERIDAIISTGPPFSSHLLALRLAGKFKLPWIADFRDGWTNNDFLPPGGALHRKLQSRKEIRVIRGADRIAAVSKKIVSYVNGMCSDPGKAILIYNGFDPDDFAPLDEESGTFDITFMGTVTQYADPSVFFGAIGQALKQEPELAEHLRVKIVGSVLADGLNDRARENGLEGYLQTTGYLSHGEALAEMMKSQLLMFAVTVYNTTGIVTGKIFEYLASGRPILAHSPQGEAVDILNEYAQKVCFHSPESDSQAAEFIAGLFRTWRNREHVRALDRPYGRPELAAFTRKEQAAAFAELLNSIV